ncbi:MAG: SusF/SusE family outer membrane protein [Alloprevotella sp.]|nr:SusF/SusE family outer membrane protein [Alloprevotella sp.]
MVPVYGHEGEFWTLIYLNAGEEFKFAPQADWGGDFGADQLQFVDNAGAGLTGTSNVVVGNSGWYLLYVDATNKVLETYAPDVYLMGETAGEWAIAPEHKFTVPTGKDEDFVSPAFVADAELRMCVHPKEGVEWWQTEFIVLDGEIVFRGAGPDQTRVKVGAGQRAYLNFTNGTGSVK